MGEPSRARYPDAQGHIERDGIHVGWELYEGPEPTVLFAPQPALTHARGLKLILPYISRHRRTVVVDGRGNGRSDRPRAPAAYLPAELVADCIDALDATSTQEAIVVSFSLRAIVGMGLCLDHRDRVLAAVFVTPDLWPTSFYTEPLSKGEQDFYAEEDIFNVHFMRADWPRFVERWIARLFPHPHFTRQMEDAIEHALDTDAETFIASVAGTGLPDRETALAMASEIDCPAIVLQNGGGSLGPKGVGTALAEAMGATIHVFDGLGPLVGSRWPVVFNIALREFLESVRGPRPG